MASSTEDIERETALYILSYLFNRNYSQTMSAFMSECHHLKVLPEQNVMILPSVPLQNIITDYKSRQATSILVQSTGTKLAWKTLWDQLQYTLTQINNLAQEMNGKKTQAATSRSKSKLIFKQTKEGPSLGPSISKPTPELPITLEPSIRSVTVEPSITHLVDQTSIRPLPDPSTRPTPDPSIRPTSDPSIRPTSDPSIRPTSDPSSIRPPILSSSITGNSSVDICTTDSLAPSRASLELTTGMTTTTTRSPRKKTQPSKRKQTDPKFSSGDEIHQVVDALLNNTKLPNKIAHLINQSVENEVTENEPATITQSALGNILTSTDMWLDEIIASTLDQSDDHDIALVSRTPQKRTQPDDTVVSNNNNKRICPDILYHSDDNNR